MKRVEYNVTYFSTGQAITLECNCKVSYWNGPAATNTGNGTSTVEITDIYGDPKVFNITIYMNGGKVANTLPEKLFKRINVIGDNFDLHITNLSTSDEGLYICDLKEYCNMPPSIYLLQTKLLPSKLKIVNVTHDNTVNGKENCPLNLVCLVERGIPPEVLRWKKNRISIRQGGPSKLVYTFTPNKADDQSVYTCEAQNPDMKRPLTKSIQLNIKYKPFHITNVNSTLNVVEGETAHMCCTSWSNPKPTLISWNKDDKELVSSYHNFSLCYTMSNVSRNDIGNYVCSSKNELGDVSSEISLIISYPPVINIRYRNLTEYSIKREIRCLAQGEPNTYNYFTWEHQSVFNEHIRYLDGTDDGILRLPEINVSNIYQDTGFYICNVSNGIPDYHGNVYQLGRAYYLVSIGPPVFATTNEQIQVNNIEASVEIKVKVYSSSTIICHNITEVGSMSVKLQYMKVRTNHVLLKEIFYDAIVTVNGSEIIFVLNGLNLHGSRKFNVTVCNSYGQSSFIVESFVTRENSKRTTPPTAIIVTTVILTLLLVPLFIKSFCKTVEEESEVIEGLSESVENILYQSRYIQNNESILSQTPQQPLMDDVTLTGHDTRMSNQQQNIEPTDNQLNYADVVFQPSSSTNEVRILGLEDRIHYADVDVSARTAILPDINSIGNKSDNSSEKSSSEDDFVYIDQIENYMTNRTTNI
ncbi:unnamed protein product [Mytilus coruscus]|uniref:Ig-like domain-containing protein n=1 Tax=Mytilus coruscus TaxID=42192 RepID=A0A6J8DTJ9_MYTCO|nr:unnamed protein product [Mytilus coruscus]